MGREGWIYAIAFLAILGVGATIIVPRLDRRSRDEGAGWSATPPAATPAPRREEGPAVTAFEGRPEYDWRAITVRGIGGSLRGRFRPVHGGRVDAQTEVDAGVQRLRVQPQAPTVSFGAAGHQWVTLPAAALTDGMVVELPAAAPPIILRVREPDGRPAAGVLVRVRPDRPGEPRRTDGGGTLVLDDLPAGLAIVDLRTAERAGPRLRLRPGEDRDVRVTLEPAWEVTGRLADRDGSPLANARVEGFAPGGAWGRVVSTAADGTFTWRGPAVARMALRCRASGRAEVAVEVTPPAVGRLRTKVGTIHLGRAGVVIDGTVQAAHQEPDAHVLIEPAVAAFVREVFGTGHVLDRPRRAALDAEGRFRVHDLPADLPLRVSVRGAGVPVDVIVQGRPGDEVPIEIAPPAGEVLVGTLVHPDGSPAAGVTLLVSAEPRDGDRVATGDMRVVTGADGSFRRRGVAERTVYVRAYAPGRRSLLKRVELPLERPLALAFAPAVTDAERVVQGRIYDRVATRTEGKSGGTYVGESAKVLYGDPLPGVIVRAGGVSGRTGADGRFRLDGVESLAPTVVLSYAYEPGALESGGQDPAAYALPAVLRTAPGAAPLDLVLHRAAGMRFRALDAIDDRPVSFVHVLVRSQDGRVVVDRGFATHDGVVTLTGLPPGGAELTVASHDRRFTLGPMKLAAGAERDLGDVLLTHGMRIEGRVVDAAGKGLARARIGAFGKGWQHAGQDPGGERELIFRTTRGEEDGRFVLEGFDPRKPADLAIWVPGFAPTTVRVELPKFSDVVLAKVEVPLVLGGFLVLDLFEREGRAGRGPRVHGASLDVEFARDGSDFLDIVQSALLGGTLGSSEEWRRASEQLLFERRGDEGYVIGPLRPGPYTLWLERHGFDPKRRRLTVIDPKQTILVDVLRGTEQQYEGRITRLFFELARIR